jgi:TatD DNase family protein
MELVDTHCHMHWPDFGLEREQALKNARQAGVKKLICIGTDYKDSLNAVEFANRHNNIWASVGLIPHDAKKSAVDMPKIAKLLKNPKVVAIGECGLDYYYMNAPKNIQKKVLEYQLDMAQTNNLPLVFHVRDAYDDFWSIFDQFKGVRGVVHSFSAKRVELNQILARGLYVGLNGIVTFCQDQKQIEAFEAVPLNKMLLETDAPFLTPVPNRGKINESKYVKDVALFLSRLRGESTIEISASTTANANKLFKLDDE